MEVCSEVRLEENRTSAMNVSRTPVVDVVESEVDTFPDLMSVEQMVEKPLWALRSQEQQSIVGEQRFVAETKSSKTQLKLIGAGQQWSLLETSWMVARQHLELELLSKAVGHLRATPPRPEFAPSRARATQEEACTPSIEGGTELRPAFQSRSWAATRCVGSHLRLRSQTRAAAVG